MFPLLFTKRKSSKRSVSCLVFVCAASALSGCAAARIDLSDVQKYAQTAKDARSAFRQVADDWDASCQRQRDFIRVSNYDEPPVVPGEPTPSPSPMPTASSGTAPARRPVAVPTPQQPQLRLGKPELCVASQDTGNSLGTVSHDWNVANNVILDYVQALGSIANVDSKPTDIEKLSGAASKLGAITPIQATLINSVVEGGVNYFARLAERNDIAYFVRQANPAMQATNEALLRLASRYKRIVTDECSDIDLFYGPSIRGVQMQNVRYARIQILGGRSLRAAIMSANKANGYRRIVIISNQQPAVVMAKIIEYDHDIAAGQYRMAYQIYEIRSEWRTKRADCYARVQSADTYAVAIDQIFGIHRKLYESSTRTISLRDLPNLISSQAQDLSQTVADLYKLVTYKPSTGK